MKHRIILSIALVLGVAFSSLMSSDSTAAAAQAAAPPQVYFVDSGVITLGPNQLLRVTVAPAANSMRGVANVSFSNHVYTHGTCSDSGVCIHTANSETTTDPVRLMTRESASIDITRTPNSSAVRSVVIMDRPNMVINFLIIDIPTGEVRSNKLFVGGLSWDSN